MVINVEENENYLKHYDSISSEVKYLTNSLVRLKILATLYDHPSNMKDLNKTTGLIYSSISSNMHKLELGGHVYLDLNKYYLTNSTRLKIEQILELSDLINLLNEFFNILDKHLVNMIPNQSVAELYLLGKANLIESDSIEVYKMYDFVENALTNANEVKCVLPFYYENFNEKLNELVEDNRDVEVMVPAEIQGVFDERSKIKKLYHYDRENAFLLIVTDGLMILGLFKDDGYFDQNRLLTSRNEDSIKWANNLYKNFKMENK